MSKTKLECIVHTLPLGLGRLYEGILRKSSDVVKGRKLFSIVLAAARPLSLEELIVASKVGPLHRPGDSSDLEFDMESTIKTVCGLFLRVVDEKVYLVHQTARQFLLGLKQSSQEGWKHSFQLRDVRYDLAKICITYLLLFEYQKDNLEMPPVFGSSDIPETVQHYADAYPFLDYAAAHWATHFRETQALASESLAISTLDLYTTGNSRFETWFQIF